MNPAKSFNNIIIGQFALAGLPLKVYVNNRYLTITDPDDLEDPLVGFGMTDNGEMIQFAYPEVEHLSVSGNSVTIDTYNKGMEPEEPAEKEPAPEKEKEGGEDKEKEGGEDKPKEKPASNDMSDHYMPKLKDLVEITKDEWDAKKAAVDAEVQAGKAKLKKAKDDMTALKKQTIEDGVEEDEYEDLVAEASIHDLEELDKGDIVIELDSGREWTIEKIRWWLGSPQMTLVDNTPGKSQTMEFPGDTPDPNFFKYFELKESVNEDHIDTISEPYMFKVGDIIHDKDLGCKHHGSKGIVITTDPDSVRYTVTNDGNFFKPGDILQKVVDQLELA